MAKENGGSNMSISYSNAKRFPRVRVVGSYLL